MVMQPGRLKSSGPGNTVTPRSLTDYCFISVGNHGDCRLSPDELRNAGIRYPDLVSASDLVMTKPGCGIVSEYIVNRTPILYTDRGPFREYDIIVGQMGNYLPVHHINRSDFEAGNWEFHIEKALAMEPSFSPDPCNGAWTVAERFLEMLA
ncbi:hypothetical protein JXA40_03840 [bacterium]|nr:hypothetical protein [candidate division CSSED10-310 bacterium]